jgi:activating signal cointegrator complex subunit 1
LKTDELPDGLPERAVRPVRTLHLTLGVMSLLTEEKVDSVLKLLKDIDFKELLRDSSPAKSLAKDVEDKQKKEKETEVTSEVEPLKITLKGLRSMQSASKTSVLYSTPLDPDLRLFQFCKSLQQLFVQAGFIAEQKKKLLLHATILNTIYAKGVKRGGTGHGKNGKAKSLFNARGILEKYGECMWMENVIVEKVAICRMGAKVGEDGEERYEVEGAVVISEA